jgi:Domain of unknown function (DUF4288)
MDKKWYSAKQIFLHQHVNKNIKSWYEERIILISAESEEDANRQALRDAEEYCISDYGPCNFLGLIEIYGLYETELEDKTEIFSSKTISSLNPNDYILKFYPDSPTDCEKVGDKHYWHNKDGKNSACYNCQVEREGKFWENQNE